MRVVLMSRVTPPGWGRVVVSARDAAATRASRLASTGGLLLARHGGGGTSLCVWDAKTMEPLTGSGECKGFASMAKNTWIGTSSAYCTVDARRRRAATTSWTKRASCACACGRLTKKVELVWRSRREPGRGIFSPVPRASIEVEG